MKPFRFQQFDVAQSLKVFRVGTDAVLLGAMCSVENAQKILEIGSGSGIISLMLAQRNPGCQILALDLNEKAVEISDINFKNSIFSDRLKVFQTDFKNFKSEEKFDFIVCNPPYFEQNNSLKDVLARQKVELDFADLIEKTASLITSNGIFSVIIPAEDAANFIAVAKQNGLHLIQKINIYGIEGGSLRRVVLEFSLTPKIFKERNFTIEKSPRQYSDEYLKLTKDFHIFRSK